MKEKNNKIRARRALKSRFAKIMSTPMPKGFLSIYEELVQRTDLYDAYIVGLVSSLLDHEKISLEPQNVKMADHLKSLEKVCEAKFKEFQKYNHLLEKLAESYVEYISIK